MLALAVPLAACDAPTRAQPRSYRLALRADLAQLGITRVSVQVTAADLATPIVQDLPIADGVASGTVEVPAGLARVITVRAFNAQDVETHRGSATVDVVAGATVTADITLAPLSGSVSIVVSVTSIGIRVTPATLAPRAGEQVALAATAVDLNANEAPLPGLAFRWTSLRPPVAHVDAQGRLTALDTGEARVVVNTGGAGRVLAFRVAPGTTLLDVALAPDSAALGAAGITTVVRVRLRDDGSAGADSVRVTLRTPAGGAGPTCVAAAPEPPTTRRAPTFACQLLLPAGGAVGDWPVGSVAVHGTVATTYDAPLLAAVGVRARLRATAP